MYTRRTLLGTLAGAAAVIPAGAQDNHAWAGKVSRAVMAGMTASAVEAAQWTSGKIPLAKAGVHLSGAQFGQLATAAAIGFAHLQESGFGAYWDQHLAEWASTPLNPAAPQAVLEGHGINNWSPNRWSSVARYLSNPSNLGTPQPFAQTVKNVRDGLKEIAATLDQHAGVNPADWRFNGDRKRLIHPVQQQTTCTTDSTGALNCPAANTAATVGSNVMGVGLVVYGSGSLAVGATVTGELVAAAGLGLTGIGIVLLVGAGIAYMIAYSGGGGQPPAGGTRGDLSDLEE